MAAARYDLGPHPRDALAEPNDPRSSLASPMKTTAIGSLSLCICHRKASPGMS